MSPDKAQRTTYAVGLIVATDGRLLLQHRDARPGVPGAGLWGLFGGRIEHGETAAQAFLREMQEELGWRPKRFEPYEVRIVRESEWGPITSNVFAAQLDVPPSALTLGEGQDLALFAPHALPGAMVPAIPDLIAEFVASPVYGRTRRVFERLFAGGLLVDADGAFLLQHRDDRPDIINPGKWATFGGHLEPYETPEEGFVREIEEELGWRPSHRELAGVRTCTCFEPEHLVYRYAAPVDVPRDSLELHEGQGMGFFPPDALPADLVPETRDDIVQFIATETYARLRAMAKRGAT